MKNLLTNLTFATLTSSLFLAYAPMADEEKHPILHLNKHKIIQLSDGNGDGNLSKVIMLDGDDLSDNSILEEKLADLDPETREKVLSLLGDIDIESFDGADEHVIKKGVVKILKTDDDNGKIIDITADSSDIDLSVLNLSDVLGDNVKTSIFKIGGNSTDAVIRMLKRGEFTQNELDQIQVALDEKR